MSWSCWANAIATDPDGNEHSIPLGEWGTTHNTNKMVDAVAVYEHQDSYAPRIFGGCWWVVLEGATGASVAEFLTPVVAALQADPERFRAMNPDNGWGSYDTLLHECLEPMLTCAQAHPSSRWGSQG